MHELYNPEILNLRVIFFVLEAISYFERKLFVNGVNKES